MALLDGGCISDLSAVTLLNMSVQIFVKFPLLAFAGPDSVSCAFEMSQLKVLIAMPASAPSTKRRFGGLRAWSLVGGLPGPRRAGGLLFPACSFPPAERMYVPLVKWG